MLSTASTGSKLNIEESKPFGTTCILSGFNPELITFVASQLLGTIRASAKFSHRYCHSKGIFIHSQG